MKQSNGHRASQRSPRRSRKGGWYGSALALLSLSLSGCVVWPGEALTSEQRLNGATTLQAFTPQKTALHQWAAIVLDRQGRQLGMATRYLTPNEWLCKASNVTDRGPLTIRLPSKADHSVYLAGVDMRGDVALLRVPSSSPNDARPSPPLYARTSSPTEGAWVSSLTTIDSVKVGIISGELRQVAKPNAMLGVILKVRPEPDTTGAVIERVIKRSAAERARLREGDRITAVNGESIRSFRHLQRVLRQLQPGSEILLNYERDERPREKRLALGDETMTEGHSRNLRMSGPVSQRRAGFDEVFQHDCPLEPKSMGGPVVNLEGQLLGMNIARSDRVTTYALTLREMHRSVARIRSHLPD